MSDYERFFANVTDDVRFREAIRHFDELNASDPHRELADGVPRPRELLNAERLSHWVMILAPDASEALRLASRCQHLCRWMIPRSSCEMTRPGYLKWRSDLKRFHAEKSSAVLHAVGYDSELIAQVSDLNLKKNFPSDPASRILEDALCLLFLQFQLTELATKTEDEKVINALRKSWNKMTPAGHAQALQLCYGERERGLITRALSG